MTTNSDKDDDEEEEDDYYLLAAQLIIILLLLYLAQPSFFLVVCCSSIIIDGGDRLEHWRPRIFYTANHTAHTCSVLTRGVPAYGNIILSLTRLRSKDAESTGGENKTKNTLLCIETSSNTSLEAETFRLQVEANF